MPWRAVFNQAWIKSCHAFRGHACRNRGKRGLAAGMYAWQMFHTAVQPPRLAPGITQRTC
jgi:hypothetical protein